MGGAAGLGQPCDRTDTWVISGGTYQGHAELPWLVPEGSHLRMLKDPEAKGAPSASPQPSLLDRVQHRRAGRGRSGVRSVFLTLLLSHVSLPWLPSLPAPVSLAFWWWKSSSLCEANDLPLCEAYWRLDLDTDTADGLSAPLLASPEPSAGPLPAAAPAHSHASGPGPSEHA